ncbi:nucleotidyltransferase family protein [Thalassotalea sp. ND16A]|uniref:nucleotidyltransferase family protein n=1 Tax=Thalassotalea sp. ND16A TaxID=1535422 RepID=UPI00051A1BE3|nr:nucleotidyltransferase family protein [Thalassotalea sp. ND16A]KGJ88756.1 hypothetical protein ND16A_2458 [Thalassotalea sp. ND16A]
MSNHVALVLAAGFSKRYGSDKRLSGKNKPMILQCLDKICAHYKHVFVIHRHQDDALIDLINANQATLIPAPLENIGIGTSIATGVRKIEQSIATIDSISIFLADMPFIQFESISAVIKQANPNSIVRPVFNHQSGHPVCFGKFFFPALKALSGDNGAMSIIKNNRPAFVEIEVSDEGVIADIDLTEHWPSQSK